MRFLLKYSFISLLVATIATLYLLCFTNQGLIIDLKYIAPLLPGSLKVEEIHGTLFAGFSLKTISYHTKEENITLKLLAAHWQPMQLLRGKLVIDSLILDQPTVMIFSRETTSNDFDWDNFKFLHRVTIKQLIIHQLSIKKAGLQFDLDGKLEDNWDFHWQLHIPTLNALCTQCTGSFLGSGNITGERPAPTINANIEANNVLVAQQKIRNLQGDAHIVIQPKQNSSIHLTATQLKIGNNLIKKMSLLLSGNLNYENHNLVVEAQLALEKKPDLFLTAIFPGFSNLMNPKQKVIATLRLNSTKLDDLRFFIPEIQHPRGIMTGNLNITGTLFHPKFTGMLNLTQGHVAIHALGIHLNDITAEANLDTSQIILLKGSFRSAKGTAQLQGNIDLNKSNFPLTLNLKGNDLNIIHLPKFKVVISPDVKLSFIYPNLALEGKIYISKASIKIKDYISAITLPDETLFVGKPQPETPDFLLAMKLHLEVNLSNDIYFSYKDFETHVGGKLLINQAPNMPATATGEIYSIEGNYTIYGQHLEIKTGRLIFAGNALTNPGLNIEAIRKVKSANSGASGLMPSLDNYTEADTTMVGVRITGTAETPQITLFSIPAGLTQAQILSSLGGEGTALLGALSALSPGTSGTNGMTETLSKILGTADVNISSVQTFNSTTNQMESTPSFVIGKQISKKLSLHYSVGIFNPVSILNVRYQYNKHWAIQSETSTIENGADVLYSFERS